MTINTPSNESSTEACNSTAGNTINDLVCSTGKRNNRVFPEPHAAFTLKTHSRRPIDTADARTPYWVERWGLLRFLPNLDTVRRFLEQIGGRL